MSTVIKMPSLRFIEMWRRLGSSNSDFELMSAFSELVRRYKEPHRVYHTFGRVLEGLSEFDEVVGHVDHPEYIMAGIFYSDAVHHMAGVNNELQSAELWAETAHRFLPVHDENCINEVFRYILLSRGHIADPAVDPDLALFLDIDLSILGADMLAYDIYADLVRREYPKYSDSEWASRRVSKFVTPMLKREHIFLTKQFQSRYERSARENLERERAVLLVSATSGL
jgi:predicted metal-dependent HD superfamily phosphohydrolase